MHSLKRKKLARKRLKKFKKKRKALYKRKGFWIVLIVLSFVGFLVWALVFSPWFQIRILQIEGLETIDEDEILSFCQEIIPKKIIFLETRSTFVFSSKKLKTKLFERYPQVKEINIKRHLPNSLNVLIKERQPIANFFGCDKFFLMDDQGVIFREEKLSELAIIKKEDIKECFLGDKILNSEELEKALFLIKYFYPGAKISEIKIYPFKLEVLTNTGWRTIFSFKKDLSKQLEELELVINEQITLEKLEELEYIDLRFDKIFYKFK